MALYQPKKLSILAIQCIRRTMEQKSDVNLMQDKDFMHMMLYYAQCEGNEAIQYEALWIFTNIVAGSSDSTKFIVDNGIIPIGIKVSASTNVELAEQAIWMLGNIIGDSVVYRDKTIELGIVEKLVSYTNESLSNSFARTIVWVIVNLVRVPEQQIAIDVTAQLIIALVELLARRDIVTRIDAMWALTYIADGGEDFIQLIIDSDIVRRVIPLLSDNRQRVQMAAIRLLGNIAVGSNDQTQVLLDNGLLNNIRFLLEHDMTSIRRCALWCLSNVTVGTQQQIEMVFFSDLLPLIADNLRHADNKVVKEATLTMHNLIVSGHPEHIIDIGDVRCIQSLFRQMHSDDAEVARAAHEALTSFFNKGGALVERYFNVHEDFNRVQQ